jgi:predicted ATPase
VRLHLVEDPYAALPSERDDGCVYLLLRPVDADSDVLDAELVKAEAIADTLAFFEPTLAVARQQQARSWELLTAMSLARRDHGKVQQAREPLAPVYGWLTEGFDTRDLKEAKALLEELA